MRRGQRTFRHDNKQDRHTLYFYFIFSLTKRNSGMKLTLSACFVSVSRSSICVFGGKTVVARCFILTSKFINMVFLIHRAGYAELLAECIA